MPPSIALSSQPDLSQLPYLLRLLDDTSPSVRDKVSERLREYGALVWPEIARRQLTVTSSQRLTLQSILASAATDNQSSSDTFLEWLRLPSENERLEAAYGWLSCLHWGPHIGPGVHDALDNLVGEYLAFSGVPDPEELSNFLFNEKGLHGADSDTYYDPQNSDLMTVIETGRGIPISLASIFILVGWRLDITIVGCNFPGHFMARAPLNGPPQHGYSFLNGAYGTDLIFDCFNGGRILPPAEVEALRKTSDFDLRNEASAVAIVCRVLHNYATSHHILGERERTVYFLNLRKQLEETAKKLSR